MTSRPMPIVLPLLLTSVLSATATAEEPLVCRLDALNAAQRERHRKLSETLAGAVVGARELPDGYALELDLTRLPAYAKGEAVCVVEVAEWVDLEARCCPFLDFGISVLGKGGAVGLTLTGGANVKAFLKMELPLIERSLERKP
jgi:hypothetical protein